MVTITRFGEKVRQLRDETTMSQSELAQRLGMKSKGYISEIEAGKKIPPAEKVLLIATVFHVTTDSLLRDELEIERR